MLSSICHFFVFLGQFVIIEINIDKGIKSGISNPHRDSENIT